MIDFRYHLVSLVAVFIALAIGIVLGAGPLREGISETLDDEVAQLRTERAELRGQLEVQSRHATAKDEAVDLLSPRGVAGTLNGTRIATVLLPGADRNHVALLEDRVADAGGALVLRVEVDDSLEEGQVDQAVVDDLAGRLALPEPREGDQPTIGAVLAASLVGADREGEVGAWLAAGERLQDEGLVDLAWQDVQAQVTDRRPPDVLLLVGGGLSAAALAEEDPELERVLEVRQDLVAGIAGLEHPLVIASAGAEVDALAEGGGQDGLVRAVRDDGRLSDEVSTVDDLEAASGRAAAVLALAWELQGEAGHYGLGDGSEAPVPAPPPLRLASGPGAGAEPAATEPVPDDSAATTAP
ncbi:copper transporter [Serinicoccus kebangsaanensis]|uniref:copper transporter n=1 Tax=Serinicoccus kebangsaanensis TaxID=2602069 RepID=UPI00178C6B3F|nr:copper transporter [Serinicoccus kebangsaanensis]